MICPICDRVTPDIGLYCLNCGTPIHPAYRQSLKKLEKSSTVSNGEKPKAGHGESDSGSEPR